MQGDMIYSYYDFIETESISHLAPEDVKFLEYKGCFHLPARPVLDELVREYFLHVHPVFPVIDEKLFWEAYSPASTRNTEYKISLFVFRAMLFVSCAVSRHDEISVTSTLTQRRHSLRLMRRLSGLDLSNRLMPVIACISVLSSCINSIRRPI